MKYRLRQISRRKTTGWHLFFQYIHIVLIFVSGIILLPICLKFIPVKLYGAWLATGNILVWMTVVDPGLSSILFQKIGFAYGKRDLGYIQEVATAGLCITAIIVLVVFAVGLFCAFQLQHLIKLPEAAHRLVLFKAFSWAVAGSSLLVFSYSLSSINKGLQVSLADGIMSVSVVVISLILTIFLLYRGFGLIALGMRLFFTGLGLCLGNFGYFFWRIRKEGIGFRFSLRRVSELYKLLVYTFLSHLSDVLTNHIDLFVIARLLGPQIVVVFNTTRKPLQMCLVLVERPSIAFMPALSHLLGSGELDKARSVLLRLVRIILWMLGLILGGFIALNDDFVRLWVGAHLFAGRGINFGICTGVFLLVLASTFGRLCFAMGNIKGNSLAKIIQAVVYLPLIILGTKYFGLLGCVIAPIVATSLVTGWYFPYSFLRILKIVREQVHDTLKELLITTAVATSLIVLSYQIVPSNWFIFTAVVTGFVLIYFCGLFMFSKAFRIETGHIYHRFFGVLLA